MQAMPFRLLHSRRQRGVALFISLVLLLVLTIIGVSSVQTTTLETRMARNEHDALLAFQSAESALRDAENFLEGVVTTAIFTDAGGSGLWTVSDLGDPNRWEQAGVWTGGTSAVAPTTVDGVDEAPRYIIEHAASDMPGALQLILGKMHLSEVLVVPVSTWKDIIDCDQEKIAGSIRLCPPQSPRVPPTNETAATL